MHEESKANASDTPLDFDSGLNSSTAWVASEHLDADSLDTRSDLDGDAVHPARALYDFEGKVEFGELSVCAGDELDVLEEDLPGGWTLARTAGGEVGLLPRTYYTFTSEFATGPDVCLSPRSTSRFTRRQASDPDTTPRNSTIAAAPLIPQNTGEWHNLFPSFRRTLLGGRTLNRFSAFVTSGAEAWVLKGAPEEPEIAKSKHDRAASTSSAWSLGDEEDGDDPNKHFIEAGPAWKPKLPSFEVLVHSPSKRTSALSGSFTMYSVTSVFPLDAPLRIPEDDDEAAPRSSRITVQRRFSQFVVLHTALTRRLPGIALPPLPEKQYAGRFSDDFVEARRGDLERYINKIVRHPILRYAEIVTFFLGCDNETEWKRWIPQHLLLPPAGPSFYAIVYHPAYNVDAEDAVHADEGFETHVQAVGKGVQALRGVFLKYRESRIEMSKAERLLSYSLLSLINPKQLAQPERDEDVSASQKGLVNESGAWCWREGCEDCLRLTKSLQRTADALQSVADLYDNHARHSLLATHESLKKMAHPMQVYDGIIQTHRAILSRYREVQSDENPNDEIAGRCETALNVTMAEMDTYHNQKVEDFEAFAKDHLDGEIAFYEQVLSRLRAARKVFEPPYPADYGLTPRQPSIYERELENPRLHAEPLCQPCPHVYDSAPMRPVTAAIQEGVGMLLASTSARASALGKLW
ncbi:hypothetical protein FISHEDRAFT_45363 [Fistulina hepatica ATCC 64428]|uniref:PX-domain-containing protein n=1 Tax=Fistulina hepatica ATCC 64428 TaxID=1128425 RepID=A0A0D7A8U7_9AGAR|nr:hypothetical protein FISHEDRAFT_45363 [Fistulina hepatica ATCC 64428]